MDIIDYASKSPRRSRPRWPLVVTGIVLATGAILIIAFGMLRTRIISDPYVPRTHLPTTQSAGP